MRGRLKREKITVVFGLVTLLSLQGCAAVMASNQPHKKNLTVLEVGKHRNYVISELGAPVTSENINGERKELYFPTRLLKSSQNQSYVMAHDCGYCLDWSMGSDWLSSRDVFRWSVTFV